MAVKVCTRITRWREASGLTQADLARSVGISASAVSQWESGQTQPSHSNVDAIVKALGISLPKFWGALPAKRKSGKKAA